MAEEEKDPVLDGFQGLLNEFGEHKKRLSLRAAEIETLRAEGKLDPEALGKIVVELFNELHDTTLSFQEDAARLAYLGFGDDGGDVDDEGLDEDEELDSLLLTADAAMLRRVVSTSRDMLTGALAAPTLEAEERKGLERFKKDADRALELIDEIEDKGDAEEDDEEGGKGGDAEASPSTSDPN